MYPRWRRDQLQPRQGHVLLGSQDSRGDLSSLLAASRELCGAVATQKLGRTTVHAQPQASECRLDGAVPGREVESQVEAQHGQPPARPGVFRGGRAGLPARPHHGLHGV